MLNVGKPKVTAGLRYEKIQLNGFNSTLREIKVNGYEQTSDKWKQEV